MNVDLTKLLDRKPYPPPNLKFLKNKRVLITGAGGSIGGELCRQMLFAGAKRLYLLGHGEDSVYLVLNDLKLLQRNGTGEKTDLVPIIGELQDKTFVEFIIKRLKADIVFHTAAHKHVPLMEDNPVECIKNNVFGTYNLVNAAKNLDVGKFVFISSDKAVEPSSVYGVSKALCEQLVFEAGDSRFRAVRFGNVIGSKGSVIPLWLRQLEMGKPITITSPEVRRFFMSISEAVSLIITIAGNECGGSLYALDMGESILIKELALRLINQSGIDSNPIIEYTGLRAGEKLEEKLWGEDEAAVSSCFDGVFEIQKQQEDSAELEAIIKFLKPICFYDAENPDVFRNKALLKRFLKKSYPGIEVKRNESKY
jgi:FlaA1/EpsC-like NDP-sugar epimerase